jgi:hypothetical protein
MKAQKRQTESPDPIAFAAFAGLHWQESPESDPLEMQHWSPFSRFFASFTGLGKNTRLKAEPYA